MAYIVKDGKAELVIPVTATTSEATPNTIGLL